VRNSEAPALNKDDSIISRRVACIAGRCWGRLPLFSVAPEKQKSWTETGEGNNVSSAKRNQYEV
jgi:hypothetical protein